MANEGAKKRVRENAAALRWLLQVLLAAAALHAVVRLGLRPSRFWHKALFALSLASSGAAYGWLRALARPTYGPQGELADGGGDVRRAETANDVVYGVAIVHALTCVSDTAWLLCLVAPGAAALWLWRNVVAPYIFTPREGEGDAGGRGRRGKPEQRLGGKATPRR